MTNMKLDGQENAKVKKKQFQASLMQQLKSDLFFQTKYGLA